MVQLVTAKGPEGEEIPALEVDGVNYVYTGKKSREALEEFAAEVRRSRWCEETAEEAAESAARVSKIDGRQKEALSAWLFDFAEYLAPRPFEAQPTPHIAETIRHLADWASENPPLVDFLTCQLRERQILSAQNMSMDIVVDGPIHRAVRDVLAGLEALVK